MRIVISSLQVSEGASKGHLHPALELALELKRRGHEPILLPLPSRLGAEDRKQVKAAGISVVSAPKLQAGIIKTPAELSGLAACPARVHEAYRSFLVAPLRHQYPAVRALLRRLKPGVVVCDLLSYAPALAARSLGIAEAGYCAGLKLAAPERLQEVYRGVRERLKPELDRLLSALGVSAEFRHLELLSRGVQLVFGSRTLLKGACVPRRTVIAGPLRPSEGRGDAEGAAVEAPEAPFGVVCFGSVLDPADFPGVTDKILRVSGRLGLPLIISSRKLSFRPGRLAAQAAAFPYVPLPRLLRTAGVIFHHGGAGVFSEAFFAGVPQILVPLTTDQPIQADILRRSGAGFVLAPASLREAALRGALRRCLDRSDPVHELIAAYAREFRRSRGVERAAALIEKAALGGLR